MNADLVLMCPSCGTEALADDEFCESCGMALGVVRDGRRNHFEVEVEGAAGVSDRGLRHARNEDALFLGTTHEWTVAIVSDGVSTSAAPQVAAQVAAGAAGDRLLGQLDTADFDRSRVAATVMDAIQSASVAVAEVPWMASRVDVVAPSCTIVVAVWDGATATVGWSGDSRAYWVGAESEQLTDDHSFGEHAITRWLGADAPDDPIPVIEFRPDTAGRLVLCSDGLWNHFASVDELQELIGREPLAQPVDVAGALTRCALERGGDDNVTVIVIDVQFGREELAA